MERATVYSIGAVSTATQIGMGLQNGRLTSDTTVVGKTVGEMLDNLQSQLNNQQRDLNKTLPVQYEILYIGDDKDLIKNSSVINLGDTDKSKYPALNAVSINKNFTIKDELNAKANGDFRAMTFKGGGSQSILQAIQQIISQSNYIQDAVKFLYTTDTTPDP